MDPAEGAGIQEVFYQAREDHDSYSSHTTLSQKEVRRIMERIQPIQLYEGFSEGKLSRAIRSLGLPKREHHVFYGRISKELSLPMEETGNQVEMQLVTERDIQKDLARMKQSVAQKIKWVHIGAIQLVIKSSLQDCVDTPIDIAICDKRITNERESVLGALAGNLYGKQIIASLYPKLAYNLKDSQFGRALTLYQDFKRKELMERGGRPYSITYEVSYALSNSHHTELFMGKDYIEISDIFREVAKAIKPDRVGTPPIRALDIDLSNKRILEPETDDGMEKARLSVHEGRLTTRDFRRSASCSYTRGMITAEPSFNIKVEPKWACPEGWKPITIQWDIRGQENYFPCNELHYLKIVEQEFQATMDIGGITIYLQGKAGQKINVLILGRNFLDKYKPWAFKEGGMEITMGQNRLLIK